MASHSPTASRLPPLLLLLFATACLHTATGQQPTTPPPETTNQPPADTTTAVRATTTPPGVGADPSADTTTVTPPGDGTEVHKYNYTIADIGRFGPSNPLVVAPGDSLVLNCLNGSFSNLWRLNSERQVTECNCAAVQNMSQLEGARGARACDLWQEWDVRDECYTACESDNSRQGDCLGGVSEIRIEFIRDSGNLASSRDYPPGRVYYFTSFSDGVNILSARATTGFGGECDSGFRFVVNLTNSQAATTGEGPSSTVHPPGGSSSAPGTPGSVDDGSIRPINIDLRPIIPSGLGSGAAASLHRVAGLMSLLLLGVVTTVFASLLQL